MSPASLGWGSRAQRGGMSEVQLGAGAHGGAWLGAEAA